MELIAPIALWYSFGFLGVVWMQRAGHHPSPWTFAGALLGALVIPLAAATRCGVRIRAMRTAPRPADTRPSVDALILVDVNDDPVEVTSRVRETDARIASAHVVVVIPDAVRLDASSGADDVAQAEMLALYTCGLLTGLETTSSVGARSEYTAVRGSAGVALVSKRIVGVPFRGGQARQSRALARQLGMGVVTPSRQYVPTMTLTRSSETALQASRPALCTRTSTSTIDVRLPSLHDWSQAQITALPQPE